MTHEELSDVAKQYTFAVSEYRMTAAELKRVREAVLNLEAEVAGLVAQAEKARARLIAAIDARHDNPCNQPDGHHD